MSFIIPLNIPEMDDVELVRLRAELMGLRKNYSSVDKLKVAGLPFKNKIYDT